LFGDEQLIARTFVILKSTGFFGQILPFPGIVLKYCTKYVTNT